jgi:hypothetical protein
MTKITLTIATALLAGTTLTSAANAGGIRVGFGFPLGSFIAHPNQSYSGGGYDRNCAKERRVRRTYQAEAAPVHKIKRPRKIDVASAKPESAPVVKTAKLEDALNSDPTTTTDIAKTNPGSTTPASPAPTAAATTTPATTTTDTAKTDTTKTDKVATADKTPTDGKADITKATSEAKQICRRYSAAIAGLVDVPCNE